MILFVSVVTIRTWENFASRQPSKTDNVPKVNHNSAHAQIFLAVRRLIVSTGQLRQKLPSRDVRIKAGRTFKKAGNHGIL